MNQPIDDALRGLDAWLASNLPDLHASLNPGASDAELDAAQARIGRELPAALRALYRWRDGQEDDEPLGLFMGLPFVPLERALDLWAREARTLERASATDLERWAREYASNPPHAVARRVASLGWFPIADDSGGAYVGVDLDPGEEGAPGQVINFGGRELVRFVLARDLEAFVRWLAAKYARGEYALVDTDDEDVQVIACVDPDCDHFLDWVRRRGGIA